MNNLYSDDNESPLPLLTSCSYFGPVYVTRVPFTCKTSRLYEFYCPGRTIKQAPDTNVGHVEVGQP